MFTVEDALAIYAYTLECPIYRLMNRAMSVPERINDRGEPSPELRQWLPYIKFLDCALARLPPSRQFSGDCFRGVK
jgi:hypothetical protein